MSHLLQVPDYLEFISQPMDFATMRSKLEGHVYCSISDLEKDFDLVISNCLKYNSKDTMFHKAALQLREVGGAILRQAHRQFQSIGLDPSTGMHLPDAPNKHGFYNCTWDDGEFRTKTCLFQPCFNHIIPPLFYVPLVRSSVDSVLDPDNRLHLTTDEQLKALLDKLDMVTSMRTSGGRTKRIRLLRREINSLRQKLKHPQQSAQAVNGTSESTAKKEEEEGGKEEEEEAVAAKEGEKKKEMTNDNGPLTAVPECGPGEAVVFTFSVLIRQSIHLHLRPCQSLFMCRSLIFKHFFLSLTS